MSQNNMTISRTNKSVKNAKFALFFYFINLALSFFSRKAFIDYLGIEILGLNTTAVNLLSFLNLAELGIGSAISYSLYRPLFENDRKSINEIVSVQGWLYRRIAYIVIVGAFFLMLFFPLIFKKTDLPLWYAYGSFIVLLIGSLLSYFVNYRQIVLTADQKEYKVTLNVQGFKVLKVIFQIVAIVYLSNGYIYWLILEVLMAFITAFILDRVLKKEYPWLKTSPTLGKKVRSCYPEIIQKTKQLFLHKISAFILGQTSPLIIYIYASLSLVAIYGNYMLIISGVTMLVMALFNSINGSIGNLVAEGDSKRINYIYWELATIRFWLASVLCFGLYNLTHSFITLWIGEEFVLSQSVFVLLLVYTFISLTRVNDSFLVAYGLFRDIWAPITEAILNLGCSLMLGYYFGLLGILLGVVISLLLIVCCWKPYFLFKYGFRERFSIYILKIFKLLLLITVSWYISFYIINLINLNIVISNFMKWGEYACLLTFVYVIVSVIVFCLFESHMRKIIPRIK